jgi:hypothetical protein
VNGHSISCDASADRHNVGTAPLDDSCNVNGIPPEGASMTEEKDALLCNHTLVDEKLGNRPVAVCRLPLGHETQGQGHFFSPPTVRDENVPLTEQELERYVVQIGLAFPAGNLLDDARRLVAEVRRLRAGQKA